MSIFASTFRRVVTPARSAAAGSAAPPAGRRRSRNRTSRPSSCASKWTSLAPSSAASSMIELTIRTIGPSETPSSSSRSAIGVVRRPRDRRASRAPHPRRGRGGRARRRCRRARRRRARAGSASRGGARRSPGRSAGRRARRGASRPRGGTAARPRGGARAAGISSARLGRDAGQPQVDQRQPVARGEHPGDALARGEPLRDERVGERCCPAGSGRGRARGGRAGRAWSPRSGRRRARRGSFSIPSGVAVRAPAVVLAALRPASAGGCRSGSVLHDTVPAPQRRLV